MEAMTLATKICLIDNGDLQQYDAPLDVYNKPNNLFVADFVGNPAINFIDGKGKQVNDEIELTIFDDKKVTSDLKNWESKIAKWDDYVADIEDKYWVDVDYEQVLAWNPEYIIIAAEAEYTVEDVLNDANLADVEAVKNNNVYKLPGNAEAWDSPVPSGILGSVWAASVLHPDEMSEQKCNEIIDGFYSEFYGFRYSET